MLTLKGTISRAEHQIALVIAVPRACAPSPRGFACREHRGIWMAPGFGMPPLHVGTRKYPYCRYFLPVPRVNTALGLRCGAVAGTWKRGTRWEIAAGGMRSSGHQDVFSQSLPWASIFSKGSFRSRFIPLFSQVLNHIAPAFVNPNHHIGHNLTQREVDRPHSSRCADSSFPYGLPSSHP
jgi:hypothetical protein